MAYTPKIFGPLTTTDTTSDTSQLVLTVGSITLRSTNATQADIALEIAADTTQRLAGYNHNGPGDVSGLNTSTIFYLKTPSSLSVSTEFTLTRFGDSENTNPSANAMVRVTFDGSTLRLYDSTGTSVASMSWSPSTSTLYKFKLDIFHNGSTGQAKLYVVSQGTNWSSASTMSATSINSLGGTKLRAGVTFGGIVDAGGGTLIYDAYCIFQTTSFDESGAPEDLEIFGYKMHSTTSTQSTDSLPSGEDWGQVSEYPINVTGASNVIELNDVDASNDDMFAYTDNASGIRGPNLDSRVDGDANILAASWGMYAARTTGSGKNMYVDYGNNTDGRQQIEMSGVLGTSHAWFQGWSSRDTCGVDGNVPTSSQYCLLGFGRETGSGRDFHIGELFMSILHEPSAAESYTASISQTL